MNIITFIKSLLPNFSKSRIVDDARLSFTELEINTVPSYKEAEKLFTDWKYRSDQMKDFNTIFKRIVKTDNDVNMVVSISRALNKILDNKEYIQDKIDRNFEAEIVADGISSLKANLIRIAETVSFISDYALLFLNYIYILETAEINKETGYVRSSLSPAEIEYLQKSFTDFCLGLNTLNKDKKKFASIVDEIPDVLLDINTGAVVLGTVGEERIDPLLLNNLSGNTYNPIYHIRLMVTERQVTAYKRNKELKKVLEMRLLNLTMQLEKTPDAKLEKEINYIQSRVQGLDHVLKRMEN